MLLHPTAPHPLGTLVPGDAQAPAPGAGATELVQTAAFNRSEAAQQIRQSFDALVKASPIGLSLVRRVGAFALRQAHPGQPTGSPLCGSPCSTRGGTRLPPAASPGAPGLTAPWLPRGAALHLLLPPGFGQGSRRSAQGAGLSPPWWCGLAATQLPADWARAALGGARCPSGPATPARWGWGLRRRERQRRPAAA